jgi:hypothetical protein
MAINLTDEENCANQKQTETQLKLRPDPNHQRPKETIMAKHPIGAESVLCNSNILDFRQAQQRRAMQTATRPDLQMAIAIAKQTKARYEYLSATNTVEHLMGAPIDAGYPEIHRQWDIYQAQIFDLAQIPPRNTREKRMKHAAIGNIWLRAKGPWYDQLREFVARDEKIKRGTCNAFENGVATPL